MSCNRLITSVRAFHNQQIGGVRKPRQLFQVSRISRIDQSRAFVINPNGIAFRRVRRGKNFRA